MAKNYLSTGSKGKIVESVQEMLNEHGYNLEIDGVYGPKTEAAVKAYQKEHGLKVDGLAGVETIGSLKNTITTPGFTDLSPNTEISTAGADRVKPGLPELPTTSGNSGSNAGNSGSGTNNSGSNAGSSGSNSAKPGLPELPGNTGSNAGNSGVDVIIPSTGGTTNNGAGDVAQGDQSYTYAPFQPSQSTQDADAKRQQLQSQKPGDFSYADYTPSDIVQQANALLQQYTANKPGDYISQYASQMQAIMDQYMNRDKFSYDMNSDALYRQYADQYQLMGQQAMMDTMGQAQAMTGGYGNSYAQSVGQQAYQGYLQQLNEVVPELYQMAYDRYNQEGQDMLNQYGLLSSQDEMEYGRYRDMVSDYYTELSRLTEDARYKSEDDYGKYMDKYNMAYGQYRDSVSDWQSELDRADSEYWNQYSADYGQYSDDRNLDYDNYWNEKDMAYQQERDKASDDKWAQEFEYQKYRDSVSDQRYAEDQAAKAAAAAAAAAKDSEPKYADFGYEEQAKWDKAFQDADSLAAVEHIADRMAQSGVDPQIVAQWYDYYAEQFMDEEQKTPVIPPKKPVGGGGGGSGAGTAYIDLK